MKRRLLSVALVLCLMTSLLPTVALAAGAAVQTTTTIANGATDPTVVLTADQAFDQTNGILTSNYTIDTDTTGLTLISAELDTSSDPSNKTINLEFTGTAAGGTLSITVEQAAFDASAGVDADSNTVTISVPAAAPAPAPADIANLTIAVSEDGTITGDTATDSGTLSYYIVDADKQSVIDNWNVETAADGVAAALSATAESSKPALTADDHNDKFLVVVETKDSKVVAAGQSAAIAITPAGPVPTDIADLTITVDTNGGITGDTATAGGDLSYYIVSDSKQSVIDSWNVETAADGVAAALSATAESGKPTLTADDHNGKFLVVVETKDSKVVAAGQSAAINIAAAAPKVDALTVTVGENGTISVTGNTDGNSLTYYFADSDISAQISALEKGVKREDAESTLHISATSGTPAVTAANNGKYLVVLESESSGGWRPTYTVVAGGQFGPINVTKVSVTGLTINASGSIKIDATASGGTYYYAVVGADPTAALQALTTSSTRSEVEAIVGTASDERPILSDTQNGQYLVVFHDTGAAVDQYGVKQIEDVVPGIKDVYDGMFYIGGTISPGNITSSDYTKWEFIQKHYNALTPENDTKPDVIWNDPNNAFQTPTSVDNMLDALGDDFYKIGHALAWHNQSTNWPFKAGNTAPTYTEAKTLLETYIKTVAGHFQERADNSESTFNAWDVVNEAMRDNPENPTDWRNALRHGDLPIERPARWYEAYANGGNGWDYIYDAFVFARQYAPDATLFYNDFNDEELPNKAIAIASMVKELNARYAEEQPNGLDSRPLIEGIGIQSHYSTRMKIENLEEVLKIYEETGCQVHITELDVQINGTVPNIPTAEQQEVQADFYAELFKLYKKYDHIIERVTWWGTNDQGNWRSSQRCMVFDNNWEPKKAFDAVIDPEGWLGYGKEAPVLESFTYDGSTWDLKDDKGAGVTYEFDVHVPDSVSTILASDIQAGLGLSAGTSATVTLSNNGAVADGAPCTATIRVSWDDEPDNYTDYTVHFGHMTAEWRQDMNYPDTGYRSTVDIRFSDGVSQLTLQQVITNAGGAVVETNTETIQVPAKNESGTYWVASGSSLADETLTVKKTLTNAAGKEIAPTRYTKLGEPEAYYQLATEVKVGQTYIIVASDSGAAFTHRVANSSSHNGKYQGTSGIVVEDDVITAPDLIQDNIRFVFNPLTSPDTDVTSEGFALQSLVHGGLIQPFILWRDPTYDRDGFARLYSDKTIADDDLDRAVWYATEMDPDTHETVLFLRTASKNETFVLESTDGGVSFGAYGGTGSVADIVAAHPNAKVKLYEYVTAYDGNDIVCESTGNGTVSSNVSSANPGDVVTVYATPGAGYEVSAISALDGNGNSVAVSGGNGVYTFVMPDTPVTVTVSFTASSTGGGSDSGSSGSSSSQEDAYEIRVESSAHGDVESNRRRSSAGSTVTLTVTPDSGYRLDTLVVTDKKGGEITLTSKGNNKYTFSMPKSNVTVKAAFVEDLGTSSLPFLDVAGSAWYYDAVAYAYENGLMNGAGAATFGPNITTSRAMIATILYRLEGEPRVTGSSFADVKAGAYYADAVAWASASGIVTGYADGTFAPDKAVTRQEMAAMLYRYAAYKGYDVTGGKDLSGYSDSAQVSAYAVEALQWATGKGLITDMGDGTLNPAGSAVRAQVATILMRFCEKIVK